MALELQYQTGQTPLDEDEKGDLLIKSISTREELDQFEQKNIENAIMWTMGKKFSVDEILNGDFIKALHKRMYGDVWGWAGEFRKTNKNIGVDKYQISISLRQLLDDVKLWIDKKVFAPDEIAIRFKHRIVNIHCFPNGNGRHSRLIADILAEGVFNNPVFTWGRDNLVQQGDTRTRYLNSIWAADGGNIEPLLNFARS